MLLNFRETLANLPIPSNPVQLIFYDDTPPTTIALTNFSLVEFQCSRLEKGTTIKSW